MADTVPSVVSEDRVRLGVADLVIEACAGVMARPARAALTALGTVLGIAALVATIGLASTAGAQIITRLDVLAATDVVVEVRPGRANAMRWDAATELMRLNGVVAAGSLTPIRTEDGDRPTTQVVGRAGTQDLDVIAVSPSLWPAVSATMASGRTTTPADERRDLDVGVLGPSAARALGITEVSARPVVMVDAVPVTIVGILGDTARRPELSGAVIITESLARRSVGIDAPSVIQIETELGANELIRSQAPTLLAPTSPDSLVASSPPLPTEVKASISDDVTALLIVLGAVSLLVGALGIANVTLVSVLERTGEIGVRRALGALRRHIGAQFVCESTVIGFIGGAVGTGVGVLVVVTVALANSWVVTMPVEPIVAAAPLGAVVGFVAGLYPAWRASGIDPAQALRSGT